MGKIIVKDDLNRTVQINNPPKRIISLCPSITETLYHMNLTEEIVGRTSFCIHPSHLVKQARSVGGTKNFKAEIIDELSPDLIIAEKEENPKEMIEMLGEKHAVYVANVESYDNALHMIKSLGIITGKEKAAEEISEAIENKFKNLKIRDQIKAGYLIWKDPYMAAGKNTYITSMMKKIGITNVFKYNDARYPVVDIEEIKKHQPDYLFLSTEPYPFKEDDVKELEVDLPNTKIIIVDGEAFTWYGSHMLQAADYFEKLVSQL